MPRLALAVMIAAALTLAVTSLALAHAVVYPKTAKTGSYEKYVLRVPNEKATPTTRVEIRFPAGLRVTSFGDVAGWQLEVLTDSAKRIVGAVWTGSLPPQRFVEFPFVGANPKAATTLVWPVYQTYGDGVRVEWTGEEGSKAPASITRSPIRTPTRAVPPRSEKTPKGRLSRSNRDPAAPGTQLLTAAPARRGPRAGRGCCSCRTR